MIYNFLFRQNRNRWKCVTFHPSPSHHHCIIFPPSSLSSLFHRPSSCSSSIIPSSSVFIVRHHYWHRASYRWRPTRFWRPSSTAFLRRTTSPPTSPSACRRCTQFSRFCSSLWYTPCAHKSAHARHGTARQVFCLGIAALATKAWCTPFIAEFLCTR